MATMLPTNNEEFHAAGSTASESVSMLWLCCFIVSVVWFGRFGASESNLLVSLEVFIVFDVIKPRDIPLG